MTQKYPLSKLSSRSIITAILSIAMLSALSSAAVHAQESTYLLAQAKTQNAQNKNDENKLYTFDLSRVSLERFVDLLNDMAPSGKKVTLDPKVDKSMTFSFNYKDISWEKALEEAARKANVTIRRHGKQISLYPR